MSRPRRSLDVVNIPNPCTIPWQSMSGSDQVRHCDKCRTSVYNLSAMTAAEADALLRAEPDGPCVRFYRRADGTVVTADRCGGRAARAWMRLTATASAMLVAVASLAGCDCVRLGICTQGKVVAPPAVEPPPPGQPEDNSDDCLGG
jgi:hypothetical protein